jgi:diacylglycerol kinase family enzyme
MGRTLYGLFIEGYTRKQWGCEPSELSSAIAPKRVELRADGSRPVPVGGDGEPLGRLPAQSDDPAVVEVRPGALRVIT